MNKKIGLKRGTVILKQHHDEWGKLFKDEKATLEKAFGNIIIAIEHIGSTAMPNISAKPIVDINIGVKSLEVARDMKEKFEKLGYKHRPFTSDKIRDDLQWEELYVKGSESKRTHYVHVSVHGGEHWEHDLIFRDYIREHPEEANRYEKLKQNLAAQYAENRGMYTKGKKDYIDSVVKKAKIK